mmetsp:Transcript_36115/g.55463  ORF Transcript_36115/g.55463 Transcript_36115/m.55463 type:complete len:115 (+) Transcript_36115:1215-1559(+)
MEDQDRSILQLGQSHSRALAQTGSRFLDDEDLNSAIYGDVHISDEQESPSTEKKELLQTGEVHPNNSKVGSCYGTIMQMDLKQDMFLVGDIFMRKFYSVFDRDNDRVGLAEAVH